MKHDIDWTKSHNGVMLCDFSKTIELMPEVEPIINELRDSGLLEQDESEYLVDVKVHMLMDKTWPCIPNWHRDFLPRDCDGERIAGKPSKNLMYMWVSGAPLTEYMKNNKTFKKPAQQWHTFTQSDLHRGTMAEEHTWRGFVRVIPKEFVHGHTINHGQIRQHTQHYLDSTNFKW